jgi:glucose-1-phosphate cytidylyltransferase
MKVVILAGGLGSRLSEETEARPKPMVEIGGRPILWHIMQRYAAFGYDEFVIALGYKSEVIKRYFVDYLELDGSLTVSMRDGVKRRHSDHPDGWTVHLVETGLHTLTGGRLKRLRGLLGDGTFMVTYGDGVADIDIAKLVRFHRDHGRLATVTAVHPPSRFGGLEFNGDRVVRFTEKPQLGEGWINGGFFVLEPRVLDHIAGDDTTWESEPMEQLARDGELMAYRHERFWQCMDTLRDKRFLEAQWERGAAPWVVSR